MNVREANLEDLVGTYFRDTPAFQAAQSLRAMISGGQRKALRSLLRDYREAPVYDPDEIALRAAVDRLLTCCSVLEIASLTNFVPEPAETEFGRNVRPILQDADVRRYYEEFYPTRLPQLFRRRLGRSPEQHEETQDPGAIACMLSFLELDQRFARRLEDRVLLRMLDSFSIRGFRFSNVVEVVGRPSEFVERLLSEPVSGDILSQAIGELSHMMQFCFDLLQLLLGSSATPIVQSAMWNHYAYWFEIIGEELTDQLGRALDRFLDWSGTRKDGADTAAVQVYVRDAREVLTILTSRRFAGPVEELLA